MPKSKIREIAFISLPIVFLGGFGWWANGRQQQRATRENGPYRTRLVSIEDLPLTPFERWQGFDSKVRIVATDDGKLQNAAGIEVSDRRTLFGELSLVGNSGAQIPMKNLDVGLPDVAVQGYGAQTTGKNDFNALQLYENSRFRSEKENLVTTLLVNSQSISGGIARIKGNVSVQREIIIPKAFIGKPPAGVKPMLNYEKTWALESRPLEINRVLRPTMAPIDDIKPRASSQVIHLRPRDAAGGEDTVVLTDFDVSGIAENAGSGWRMVTEHIETDQGEVVWKDYLQSPSLREGKFTGSYFFNLARIPLEKGRLTLKAWVSYRDSWPLAHSVVVREKPHKIVPHKLELKSVRLLNYSAKPEIEVQVRYLGSLPVEDENNAKMGYLNTYSRRRDVPPRTPGTERLISEWSQHLEYSNGQKQWYPQFVGYPEVHPKSNNIFCIYYPLPAMNKWQPGKTARFKAQIGIESDGFLDIDLPITKPK